MNDVIDLSNQGSQSTEIDYFDEEDDTDEFNAMLVSAAARAEHEFFDQDFSH